MAKYKVQAPDGSIITIEGPDGASQDEVVQKAQSIYKQPEATKPSEKTAGDYVKDFGKATASLADTGLNAITGTLDWAAYPLARASGLSPEQAQQETTSPKDVIGRAFGITQDPAYTGEASRQITGYLGENIGRSVVEPISQVTGLPEQDVGNMVGTAGMLAPGVGRAAVSGAKAVTQPVQNFGKGFMRGMSYPQGSSAESALAPIRPTYVPHEQVTEFMAGQRPASTLTEVPTKPLYESSPTTKWAYGMAPENTQGQKLVPYAGRTAEGLGEQIGSQYRQNPITGLIDIGTTLATGIPAPVTALARTVPQLAARKLQQATQFEPGFGPAREAALAREGRAGIQANMPTTQALPAPGPVNPTMFANQQGVVTGPGGTSLPTQASGQPVTQKVQPVAPTQSPKQFSQNMAAQKLAEQQRPNIQPQAQPVAPVAPAAPVAQPVARAPKATATKAPELPKRSSETIRNELDMIARQSDELHQQGLEEGIKYGTPEGESHQAQLGQLDARAKVLQKELEEAKKLEKKQSKKKAPEVSQMLTEDTIFETKAEWEKANMFNKLAGNKPVGGYKEGEHIVRHETNDYSSVPEGLRKHLEKVSIVKRTTKGKRVQE